MSLLQKICRRLRLQAAIRPVLRRLWWQMQGAKIGAGTAMPRVAMTWPHQVQLGRNCALEDDIFFKFDGNWEPGPAIIVGDKVFIGRGCEFNISQNIRIDANCLLASGCKFIDHDHGLALDEPMNVQACPAAPIILEEDVWLGVNVTVLKGVTIGRGAVVGAGAIVTKSIPAYTIWAGVPARQIGDRRSLKVNTP